MRYYPELDGHIRDKVKAVLDFLILNIRQINAT